MTKKDQNAPLREQWQDLLRRVEKARRGTVEPSSESASPSDSTPSPIPATLEPFMRWLVENIDPDRHVLTEQEEKGWNALEDTSAMEGEQEKSEHPSPFFPPIDPLHLQRFMEHSDRIKAQQGHFQWQFDQLREAHKELAVEMEGLRYARKAAQSRANHASSLLSESSTQVRAMIRQVVDAALASFASHVPHLPLCSPLNHIPSSSMSSRSDEEHVYQKGVEEMERYLTHWDEILSSMLTHLEEKRSSDDDADRTSSSHGIASRASSLSRFYPEAQWRAQAMEMERLWSDARLRSLKRCPNDLPAPSEEALSMMEDEVKQKREERRVKVRKMESVITSKARTDLLNSFRVSTLTQASTQAQEQSSRYRQIEEMMRQLLDQARLAHGLVSVNASRLSEAIESAAALKSIMTEGGDGDCSQEKGAKTTKEEDKEWGWSFSREECGEEGDRIKWTNRDLDLDVSQAYSILNSLKDILDPPGMAWDEEE
ncbi:hypothetical protein BJ684DRAFT_15418 [Piptocephalis cylindrospora]|uniref:Uncharacterized protein n=1 Tax=Piptocephalis cylindrospora TaxID=1907219 RepID=A0A4P9Y5I8_9FUNG|nr:hypothetical protein BJ684DRAFT_15418 [Piptocephalis cylindrospora]|eukprot:RKP14237.1 hypothetical protein BJ684DRAFT_15418 [Piptocephalis cylindrospora]